MTHAQSSVWKPIDQFVVLTASFIKTLVTSDATPVGLRTKLYLFQEVCASKHLGVQGTVSPSTILPVDRMERFI